MGVWVDVIVVEWVFVCVLMWCGCVVVVSIDDFWFGFVECE